jgi:hypothetical protein
MAKALEEQRRSPDLDALPFEERLGLLVDREAAERDTKRLARRLKFAALRQSACVENADLRRPTVSIAPSSPDSSAAPQQENAPAGLGRAPELSSTRKT